MKRNLLLEKRNGIISYNDYRSSLKVRVLYWLLFAFEIFLVIISFLPILFAFLSGFKGIDEFYARNVTFFPKEIKFTRVMEILKNLNISRTLLNSLKFFAVIWFGNVIVGGVAGYTISRLKPKGSKLLFRVMLWTMMMPGTLSMVPLFMTWTDFPIIHVSFLNSYIPFIVGSFGSIFYILMFKSYFDSIPSSLIEAAKIDGCSNISIFFRIVMPLSKPIMATISIFVFTGCWNDFLGPYLYFRDPKMATVALKLYNLTLNSPDPDKLLASFIVMIPTLIIFLFFSKQIMSNDMSAGVKG